MSKAIGLPTPPYSIRVETADVARQFGLPHSLLSAPPSMARHWSLQSASPVSLALSFAFPRHGATKGEYKAYSSRLEYFVQTEQEVTQQ